MDTETDQRRFDQPRRPPPSRGRVWVVLPTYNERDNLEPVTCAILEAVPSANVLVVDDASPDGTGDVADEIASGDPRVRVLHRTAKDGLGSAYRAGFRWVLDQPETGVVVQMDCDFSHDPDDLPRLVDVVGRGADLVIASRYVRNGSTVGWGVWRRLISRGGSTFARTVLLLPYRDLTGGYKAWRAELLRRVLASEAHAQGYGFQIEMTWLAHRTGARIREIPITFRDRTVGASKMSGSIVREALLMVLLLRWQTLIRRTSAQQPRSG